VADATVAAAWTALNADAKARYLVNATRLLDSMVEWIGDRYSRDQKLSWPRVNAFVDGFYVENTIVPTPVMDATIELMVFNMANAGELSSPTNSAFDSVKVGPITIDFNEGVADTGKKFFPDILPYLLRDYGSVNNPDLPSSRMMKMGRLQRA
jgi:hypothetical protein